MSNSRDRAPAHNQQSRPQSSSLPKVTRPTVIWRQYLGRENIEMFEPPQMRVRVRSVAASSNVRDRAVFRTESLEQGFFLRRSAMRILASAERTGREKRTSGQHKNTADLRHNSHVFDDSMRGNVIRYSMRLSHNVG